MKALVAIQTFTLLSFFWFSLSFAGSCPHNFIEPYTEVEYSNVVASTAKMLEAMNVYSRSNVERHITRAELEKILNRGHFSVLCAWPMYPGHGKRLTNEEVVQLQKTMESYFAYRGLSFIRADGYYNHVEIKNSYIVLDANEEAKALAKSFAQQSLLVAENGSAKILYLSGPDAGKYYLANSWSKIRSAEQDHSAVRVLDSRSPFKFTWNFDLNRFLVSDKPN